MSSTDRLDGGIGDNPVHSSSKGLSSLTLEQPYSDSQTGRNKVELSKYSQEILSLGVMQPQLFPIPVPKRLSYCQGS